MGGRLLRSYTLFGFEIESDLVLRIPSVARRSPDLVVSTVDDPPFESDWNDETANYVSPSFTENGLAASRLFRHGEWDVWRFTEVADFYINASRVLVYRPGRPERSRVEVCLLGAVMAFWMERAGLLALHASVVSVGEGAIAFLSRHGAGKTALAASFMRHGCELMSDDILAAEMQGRSRVRSGYPAMRMWPELADHFFGSHDSLVRVLPDSDKRWVPVGDTEGLGSFRAADLPLLAVYMPRREERPPGRDIEIVPATPAEAVMGAIGCSFLPRVTHALGWDERRLEAVSRYLDGIPVRHLCYPGGLENLPRVRDAVLRDVDLLTRV